MKAILNLFRAPAPMPGVRTMGQSHTLALDLLALHFEAANAGTRRPWVWSKWGR